MSNPAFPYADQQDSSKFSVQAEDPTIRSNMDGGYVTTRPRHTRTPRKTWTTGFTNITDTQKATLETFWNTCRGGSVIMDWTNPHDLAVYQVRFTKPMQFKYVGKGAYRRWNVDIELEQA